MMIDQAIKKEQKIRLFAVVLVLISFIAVLTLNKEIFISFLLAFLFTYLLTPIVNYLERMGLSRNKAIAIPYLIIISGLIVLGYIFTPILAEQLASLQSNTQEYIDGIKALLARWEGKINKVFLNLYSIRFTSTLETYAESGLNAFVQSLPSLVSTTLTTSLLAPIIAYFMLQDGRFMIRRLLSLIPNNLFELSLNLTYQINEQMGYFIRARILESVIIGITVWLGLYLIDFPYSIFLAIFAGLTNLIPYIGPIIGAIPAFILAAINPELNPLIVFVAVVYLIAQLIDILFIIPLIVARTVNLHPVTVLLAIILGAKVMGILGMLIAIPAASIIKVAFTAIFNHLVQFRA